MTTVQSFVCCTIFLFCSIYTSTILVVQSLVLQHSSTYSSRYQHLKSFHSPSRRLICTRIASISSSASQDLPTQGDGGISNDADWAQAELTLRQGPYAPSSDIDPEKVALIVVRSLQWIDYPYEASGLKRTFHFLTWECRKTVTARRGADTVERFVQFGGLAPAFQPFMGANRITIGQGTYTQAQPPTRGAIVSFPVLIQGNKALRLQYPSGLDRNGVMVDLPKTHFVLRLEQQRRPPLQGCWLVREILDVRHAFAGDMGNAHVGG